MKRNPSVLLLIFFVITTFLFTSLETSASIVSLNGCHKPDSGWLYPENGFNLSGVVDIYWVRAEADYYEEIVYRLTFNTSEAKFFLIDKAVSTETYVLNTSLLPQGKGSLSVESFDRYVSNAVSVNVNINQSLLATPLDPNVLENPDVCSFDDFVTTTTIPDVNELSLDWIVLFAGIFVSIFSLRRFYII